MTATGVLCRTVLEIQFVILVKGLSMEGEHFKYFIVYISMVMPYKLLVLGSSILVYLTVPEMKFGSNV